MKWHKTSEELPEKGEEVIGIKYFKETNDVGYIIIVTTKNSWFSPFNSLFFELKDIPYWTKLEPPIEVFPYD
jgi:hypothetical protein